MADLESRNLYAPPTAPVADDPKSAHGHELADPGVRLAASILDGLGVMAVVVAAVLGVGGVDFEVGSGSPRFTLNPLVLLALGGLLAWTITTTLFVSRYSQTIGKRVVGIKVVRSDGSRAAFGRIFWLRNVVNALPNMLPGIGGAYGLIDSLFVFSERRRCLHDRIADTIVVKV